MTPEPEAAAAAADEPEVAAAALPVADEEEFNEPAMENEEEEGQSPEWANNEKHVFILSIAGKPIYSRFAAQPATMRHCFIFFKKKLSSCTICRHGNEDKLASIMGVMQALVSFVQDEQNQLRSVFAHSSHLPGRQSFILVFFFVFFFLFCFFLPMNVGLWWPGTTDLCSR